MKNNLQEIIQELTGKKEKNLVVFIEALKECLKKDSFEKISVSDIVETAGKSRQTFYRCCDNKYDLVNKYLGMIIIKSCGEIEQGKSLKEALAIKYQQMESEKDLFAQTFISDDYESLHHYTHRLITMLYRDLYERKSRKELDERQKDLLDIFCEGSIYATVKWSCREIDNTPEEMAELLLDAMPPKVKKLYKDYL